MCGTPMRRVSIGGSVEPPWRDNDPLTDRRETPHELRDKDRLIESASRGGIQP